MRWPRIFKLAEEETSQPGPDAQFELGVTGLRVVDGIVDEEWNEHLQDVEDRMQVFEKMRKSDGTIATIEDVIKLPLLSAQWSVEPGEPGQEEWAETIEANLMGGMTITWQSVISHFITGALYGFTVFEKVWEEREGLLALRKLAPRNPRSHSKWLFDEAGGLAGWQQTGDRVTAEGTQEVTVDMPIEKLIVATYNGEYGNPEGTPILRSLYRHSYTIDKLYTLLAIKSEREACGTPTAAVESDTTEDVRDKIQNILSRIRGTSVGGIVYNKNDMELDTLDIGNGNVSGIMPLVMHHRTVMMQRVFSEFLSLGQEGLSGSRALAGELVDILIMSLEGIANWIIEFTNRYAIKQYVDWNWGPQEVYPTLAVSKIGLSKRKELAETIREIFDPAFDIGRLPEIEEHLRNMFDLPEGQTPLVGGAGNPVEERNPAPRQPDNPQPPDDESSLAASDEGTWQLALDPAEVDVGEELREISADALRIYMARLSKLAETKSYTKMVEARVPFQLAMKEVTQAYLIQVSAVAAEQIEAELGQEVPLGMDTRKWANAKALLLSERIADNMQWVGVNGLIEDLRNGLDSTTAMQNASVALTDTMQVALGETLPGMAKQLVIELQG